MHSRDVENAVVGRRRRLYLHSRDGYFTGVGHGVGVEQSQGYLMHSHGGSFVGAGEGVADGSGVGVFTDR